jgi:soluble lytic murein transglycosylase-like protein
VVGSLAAAVLFASLGTSPRCPYDREISRAVASVTRVYSVPKALVKAVIAAESSCSRWAVSPAGALGLMQLLPETALMTGIAPGELFDPERNILAGTRFLATLLHHYHGDIVSVLVAYNAGPREPYAPIPENGETPRYVSRVLGYLEEFSRESRAIADARQ